MASGSIRSEKARVRRRSTRRWRVRTSTRFDDPRHGQFFRRSLTALSEQAENQAAREASRHKSTQALGNALQNATALRDEHRKEVVRKQQELQSLQAQRTDAEETLKSQQRYSSILEQRDGALSRLDDGQRELQQKRVDLQRTMSNAWRSVLCETIRTARLDAQGLVQSDFDQLAISLRHVAVDTAHCPTCEQDLTPARVASLRNILPPMSMDSPPGGSAVSGMGRLAELNRFRDTDNSGEIKQLGRRLRELEREQIALRERIDDLNTQLNDADPEAIRRSQASYTEILSRMVIVKQAIDHEDAKAEAQDQNVQRLHKVLEASGTQDLLSTQRRGRTLRESAEVFGEAIERYKAALRTRVEATASELFRAMTTEKEDYAALSINENYGLTILHRDGRAEIARSAGAEHVVALALMGALQRNAPLRGPIVMDSPFGRLDDEHTSNVVKALPQMADQVILLVYEAEVGRTRMRELLGKHLKCEYQLQKMSARRTIIAPVQ